MKKLLLLLLTIVSAETLAGQVTWQVLPNSIVERVEVTGISDSRFSQQLRGDIQALAGKTYNADMARQLADDIQLELPEYVAAATPQPGSQSDRIRVTYVVAKISDSEKLKANINARYIVDAVDVGGIKAKLSPELTADLQAMVGKNLDNDQAEALRNRMKKEVEKSDFGVDKKLKRGDSINHVRILYEVQRSTTTGFSFSNGGYHSKEGWVGTSLSIRVHYSGYGTISVVTKNDADNSTERFVGGALGYSATRGITTIKLEYSSYRAQWKPNTLEANRVSPQSPGLYRLRDAASVSADFKFRDLGGEVGQDKSLLRQLKATIGTKLGELQMQSGRTGYRKDNAFYGSVSGQYHIPWNDLNWRYDLQSGTGVLGSDLSYTKHSLWVNPSHYFTPKTYASLTLNFGRVTGNAPMYQRFSLGSMNTLRGWNKYEIAPLGGNRYVNSSAEFHYKFLSPFYDFGSVWDAGKPAVFHQSVGIAITQICKFKNKVVDGMFCHWPIAIGIPITSGTKRPTFFAGAQ